MQPITDDLRQQDITVVPTLSKTEMHDRWERLEGTKPPTIPLALLRLFYAQRVREHAYGGIPDWVLAACKSGGFGCRTTSPAFLNLTKTWYVFRDNRSNTVSDHSFSD